MAFLRRMVVPLREGEHRLNYAPGDGEVLVIAFASIGQKRRLMPRDEFTEAVLSQGGVHALFVADKRRSWLNAPALVDDLRRAVRSLREVDGVRRVITLGASMGGYSALAAAHHFEVDAALAMAPQVLVHPEVVPDERRWRHWRERIDSHLLRSVAPLPARGYFALVHALAADDLHARRFGAQSNVDQWAFDDLRHHEIGERLSRQGAVSAALRALIAGDRPGVARALETAGAARHDPGTSHAP